MNARATVIILPPMSRGMGHGRGASPDDGPALFGALQHTLYGVLSSGLPMVLAAPKTLTDQAQALMPQDNLVEIAQDIEGAATLMARSVAAGVLHSSQSPGWLVLPGDMPMLRIETLLRVADALQHFPIAYPLYRARRGHPMGFGRELFSELIHLDLNRDLYRLSSRYPAEGIDVDDPGVVLRAPSTEDDSLPSHPDGADFKAAQPRSGWGSRA